MRKQALLALSLLTACSSRPIDSDCDGMCQPAGPNYPGVGECKEGVCTPTYADCTERVSLTTTCAEVCEAQGTACATNGCAGDTYRIYSGLEWCEDPERSGGGIQHECNEPIDWQLNWAVKCCCEQE
jgi:hypothetical protein